MAQKFKVTWFARFFQNSIFGLLYITSRLTAPSVGFDSWFNAFQYHSKSMIRQDGWWWLFSALAVLVVLKPNHFQAIKLLNYIFSPLPVLHTKEGQGKNNSIIRVESAPFKLNGDSRGHLPLDGEFTRVTALGGKGEAHFLAITKM